ncbi:MAG: 1-deoxy-D-xylulose-5-phosphate reductoisomerase [Acutalibacteraceae bacterium]
MAEKITLLGSTGSIGCQTLDVARNLHIKIEALSANKSIDLLEKQIREFNPRFATLADDTLAQELKKRVADTDTEIIVGFGAENLQNMILKSTECDTVVNALVGISGFMPTVQAISCGKNIALANKETLVVGGAYIMNFAREKGVKIYPVDSEHSAIFQCLQGCPKDSLKKLILTASGGPFFGKTAEELKTVTVTQALAHPNWSMGAKITVDSATMMNKGFEIMEASWLFGVKPEDIDVVVHRESIIHSMIELKDNAVLAQLGTADMRIPIQYALTYPKRYASPAQHLDLLSCGALTFAAADEKTFPAMQICRKAMEIGGIAPAVVNGANEIAVAAFLEGKISFNAITETVAYALEKVDEINKEVFTSTLNTEISPQNILKADKVSRSFAHSYLMI